MSNSMFEYKGYVVEIYTFGDRYDFRLPNESISFLHKIRSKFPIVFGTEVEARDRAKKAILNYIEGSIESYFENILKDESLEEKWRVRYQQELEELRRLLKEE